MTCKTKMSGLLIFFFVFIGATVIPAGYAQQSSDLGNTAGRQPGRATSTTKENRETSAQARVGSAWQAGQAEMANSAKWGAEQQGVTPAQSTVWTAGAGSFGAAKQPGGIWSELQNSGAAKSSGNGANHPEMPALLITPTPLTNPGPNLMPSPAGISRTRAASLGKSHFQLSSGGGTGESGNSRTTLGAGGPQNPFASKMQSTSRIGTGSGPGSSRQAAGSGSHLDSSLKDNFVSDGQLDSAAPQDIDPASH